MDEKSDGGAMTLMGCNWKWVLSLFGSILILCVYGAFALASAYADVSRNTEFRLNGESLAVDIAELRGELTLTRQEMAQMKVRLKEVQKTLDDAKRRGEKE